MSFFDKFRSNKSQQECLLRNNSEFKSAQSTLETSEELRQFTLETGEVVGIKRQISILENTITQISLAISKAETSLKTSEVKLYSKRV
jgi:hypothetical protein